MSKKSRKIRLAVDKSRVAMATSIKHELSGLGVRSKIITIEHGVENTERFPCGEVKPRINGNVRNRNTFHLPDFSGDPNDDLVRFLLSLQALHLADAKRVTTIPLYLPYMRQDRKDEPRVPISAKWVIENINRSRRVKRAIVVDIHSEQMLSNFHIPTDHLPGRVLFAPWARERFAGNLDDLVVVAPDEGSYKRALKLAASIGPMVQVSMFNKDRQGSAVKMLNIIGASVKGKVCLLNDDMMDTCGTIILAAEALKKHGAQEVIISATHPVFSTDKHGVSAYEKLEMSGLEIVVSDSLIREPQPWLTVLPWAKYLAHVIYQNIPGKGGSVSKLIRQGLPDTE